MPKREVYLEIIEGPYKGQRFDFSDHHTFTIGRGSDCTVCLKKDTALSRRHLLFVIDGVKVRIRDLGSLNGTSVNGRPVYNSRGKDSASAPPPEWIGNGDYITIGSTRMVVHIHATVDDVEWAG